MIDLPAFAALSLAFVICLTLVPLAKRLARGIGLVDQPDKTRKLHAKAIPLAGGIAVFSSIIVSVACVVVWGNFEAIATFATWEPFLPILAGGAVILGIGVVDDWVGMRGRTKLLGQILACCLFLLLSDQSFKVGVFGIELPVTVSLGIVMIWMLGAVNAMNLIDGADGMASTVGTVAALAMMFMAISTDRSAEAFVAAALAGGLVAFLLYNFPPASVFLGDAGSMLIGFLVGAIAIGSSHKQAASITMFAPAAVIALPLFDSFVAILRRRLTGRSIYTVDRGHLHHAILGMGFGPRRLIAFIATLSTISAMGAVMSVILDSWPIAAISIGIVVCILVFGRFFGFSEFLLLKSRFVSMSSKYMGDSQSLQPKATQQKVQLQGSRNWDQLWETITDFAEQHHLAQVRLDLNLPWLHEGYHATWQRPLRIDAEDCWKTSLPLAADEKRFGRLEVVGPLHQFSVYMLLSKLSELLESLEPTILSLAHEDHSGDRVRATPSVVTAVEPSEEELAAQAAMKNAEAMQTAELEAIAESSAAR